MLDMFIFVVLFVLEIVIDLEEFLVVLLDLFVVFVIYLVLGIWMFII